MVRFAVIGTNFITDNFIEALKECKNAALVAIYSRNITRAKEYANKHGAKLVFDKLEDLADCDQVDVVYVASPNSLHFSQSIIMLNNKKHVLCEKSIASNSKELTQMLNTACNNNVILLEAMRSAFDPEFLAIAKNLDKLGVIRRATLFYCKYSSRYDNFKKGIIENAFNPELSNGSLMDIGVYCVHALVKLFGLPKEIVATGIMLENGIDGSGTILAEYDEMQAELIYSKIANSYMPSEIQGEEATMIIDSITKPKDIVIRYRNGKEETIHIKKQQNNMYYEIEELVSLIEHSKTAKEHNQYSIMELKIMDEARRQMGIVFPADKEIK